jgi:excinuclease ABC subunit A
MSKHVIKIRGARQNNLKGLDLDLPLGAITVVTGPSGSGKSSLAFDTVYAEGQRRYVETFSPYARQFLDRQDRPHVERIEGIPPAIAIDQVNPVRNSRSTVGTMSELADHLKLLFARAAPLYCRNCGHAVERDSPEAVADALLDDAALAGTRVAVTFKIRVPNNFSAAEVTGYLEQQGYTRIRSRRGKTIEVIQDRVRLRESNRGRLNEALEAAFARGHGYLAIHPVAAAEAPLVVSAKAGTQYENASRPKAGTRASLDSGLRRNDDKTTPSRESSLHPPAPSARPPSSRRGCKDGSRYSTMLHCARCDIDYSAPTPGLFSFNSPAGACPTCKGFGRTQGIDYGLVMPDESLSLAEGAIKPFQTKSFKNCQRDLIRYAKARRIPTTQPWRQLTEKQKRWVIEGEGGWRQRVWYGVERYFKWLESKSYRMHIRVLLSRYRAYNPCPDCHGARLKSEAFNFRLGTKADADAVLAPEKRFHHAGATYSEATLEAMPGLTLHDINTLAIGRVQKFFAALELPAPFDEATEHLLGAIRARLDYLATVGLDYLTLDRQSRTLSGGEVQRINLTTALGTSLTNTLFVLDEPSIGLHPRDISRLIAVLDNLRAAGNTLLVVEHDPQIMLAADRLLDLGPAAGKRGGEVQYFGKAADIVGAKKSATGAWLAGQRNVTVPKARRPDKTTAWLTLEGASEHNLKHVTATIPLNRLVCLTGVSGSGKSTLMEEVLYRAVRRRQGRPTETPGAYETLTGDEHFDDIVLVDQSAIGRTTRSNPASYVGAFDAIRKCFVKAPLARERGYTPGTFSFNTGNGRCPGCGGTGFEHIEMQFLSDVYLRCPDCNGRRYRDEVLEVTIERHGRQANLADVLEMTVEEAAAFFSADAEVVRCLQPLQAVGLGYLTLGQAVPTLSGGESQRLKLAGRLAAAHDEKRTLFLFDEPTTGLHFDDIAVLLGAFRELIARGHSLIVIEHNLDVVRAADWVIDIGPEGGEAGGEIVVEGTPAQVRKSKRSHTGRALADYERALGDKGLLSLAQPSPRHYAPTPFVSKGVKELPPSDGRGIEGDARREAARSQAIEIVNAHEHNLQGVNVNIPRNRFSVVTGLSGSGKSTLAFDILFAEGQRRYLESLNAYARSIVAPASRPEVDAINGIPPTVAIEQRTSRGGWKSTVGTMTEIHHFLRLLFVRLGTQHCPDCGTTIEPQSEEAIRAAITSRFRGRTIRLYAPLVVARKGYYTDLAKWAGKKGYEYLRVDGELLPTAKWPRLKRFEEHDIELPVGELRVGAANESELSDMLATAFEYGRGMALVTAGRSETLYSTRRACPACGRSFPELDPRLFSYNSRQGWCQHCGGTGFVGGGDEAAPRRVCPACDGARLNPIALAVTFAGRSIADLSALPVTEAAKAFDGLKLDPRAQAIARDALTEIRSRLGFLNEVGLGYLALDRASPTLAGGEAQRIRLAAQLGSNLAGVCYILDEPTIGLHPRDHAELLRALKTLRKKGNTVVVVEHDEATIRAGEHLIDLGPGAGANGGHIVAQGGIAALKRNKASITGQALKHPPTHPQFERRAVKRDEPALVVRDARLHNLRASTVTIPLERFVCVTGVSGSGKSSLVRGVLADNLHRLVGRGKTGRAKVSDCGTLEGYQSLERVLEVDQTPIGKTPRSCPATYVGIWNAIRTLFAKTPEARLRGFDASRFSFNTGAGRCESCAGQGLKRIEMSFMPDVVVPCETCGGARFNHETLEVTWRGKTIADVLAMNVSTATEFFTVHSKIHRALALLDDVGLGYLTLGQQSPTLSGGEAQRLKLVTELAKADSPRGGPTLYLLDEPTVGLHIADVERLTRVLHRLVAAGHSVVVIEHNLDLIAEADWIVDIGPEGGARGGRVVATGTPERLVTRRKSPTAQALADFLATRH